MHEVQQNKVLDQFLDGLRYPLTKPTVVSEAREAALEGPIAEVLERLPDREYQNKQDLVRELNAAA